jgi:hypothetical protein
MHRLSLARLVLVAVFAVVVGAAMLMSRPTHAQPPRAPAPTPSPLRAPPLAGQHLATGSARPTDLLYDQFDNFDNNGVNSQQYAPPMEPASNQAADDFPVPDGAIWSVNQVDVQGIIDPVIARPDGFNVFFYTSVVSGTYAVPDTPVYTATTLAYTYVLPNDYSIPLPTPANLGGGQAYFVSVQAVLRFLRQNAPLDNLWYWGNRSVTAGSGAVFRAPGGGGPGCAQWERRTFCQDDVNNPDEVFRLFGTAINPATATAMTTLTATPTSVPSATPTASPSVTRTATPDPSATSTTTPLPSATPCALSFSDVHSADYFYAPVRYLYCQGVISGYADNTFRPYNNTTRGQMVKIVVLGDGLAITTPATPTFADVPVTHPFYPFIETAAAANIVSGYADGTFRPQNNVTRGQLSKIDVVAAGWALLNPPAATFSDVPPGSAFYEFVETAVCHQIISGYADGSFHPNAAATRGQISKIIYLSITSGGTPCARSGLAH